MNTIKREDSQNHGREAAAAVDSRDYPAKSWSAHHVCRNDKIPRRLVITISFVGLWVWLLHANGSLLRTEDSNTKTKAISASVPPAFNSTSCSCSAPWNESATALERRGCCHRTVVSAHKMGWQLLIKINRNYLARIPGGQVRKSDLYNVQHVTVDPWGRGAEYNALMNRTFQTSSDFRTAIVTRHWYDTLVSGFLYHQSGRECSRSSGGKPGTRGWLLKLDWQAYISTGNESSSYWPPPSSEGLDLCRYLQQVPALDSMRVYMDVALKKWLRPLLRLAAAHRSKPLSRERTLFLCYEQFNSDEKFPAAIKAVGSFLYPGENDTQWEGLTINNSGGGGHSTNKDESLRELLHDIVRFNDEAYFGGEVTKGSNSFACRSERDRQ